MLHARTYTHYLSVPSLICMCVCNSLKIKTNVGSVIFYNLPPPPHPHTLHTHTHTHTQDTIPIASKHCPLWMHLLAIFSQSSQNQSLMVDKKYATPILSCMHLSLMSGSLDFQQHGWTVLGNVVATPTQPGRKVCL